MLQILLIVECVGCSAAFSAVAWLQRLLGKRLDDHMAGGLFITPILTLICVVLLASLVMHEQQMGTYAPDTSSNATGLAMVMGIVLAGMVGWVIVEARRFRVRVHDVPRDADDEAERQAEGERNGAR